MSTAVLPPAEATAAADFRARWSPLEAEKEAVLQRGPFIEPFTLRLSEGCNGRYGTVSQTAIFVCKSESTVHYAYRTLHDGAPPGPWKWHLIALASPSRQFLVPPGRRGLVVAVAVAAVTAGLLLLLRKRS